MATTPALPRGIQIVAWKNKDKSRSTRYRVRIIKKKQGIFEDQLFDELQEAKDFLLLSKTVRGREQISKLSIEEEKRIKAIQDFLNEPPFSFYIDIVIKDYIETKPKETELQRRNISNIKSFYNIIKNTEIEYQNIELKGILSKVATYPKKKLGEFKISEISHYEINNYIKTRLTLGKKKSSISREISFISKVFLKLPYIERNHKFIANPVLNYDKELLKNKKSVIEFRLEENDEKKLFEELAKYNNPQLGQIVLLSLMTSMRRSEVIYLTWNDIKQNHILLTITKSGSPRKVYLTEEAKTLLATIPKVENKQRLFDYSIAGFEGSYSKFVENIGLKHLTFKSFRKESISRFIDNIGASNSLLIAKFLGISNVKKFEEDWTKDRLETDGLDTQAKVLKHIGHGSINITSDHYYTLPNK